MPVNSTTKSERHLREPSRDAKSNEEDSINSEDDSSSYDGDLIDRRKVDCLNDIQFLEQQFVDLKERLYHERIVDIDQKIQHIQDETAQEYLIPLKELDEAFQSRLETVALLHQCRLQNITSKYEEEVQAATQDLEEMGKVTLLKMKQEAEEKLRRLQEDKIMADLTSESASRKRKSKPPEFQLPEKRKKPVTVIGPCVIYMLRDMEIMEDLNDIRRGRAMLEVHRKVVEL